MTYDVVALLAKDPDMRAISRALNDAGPGLWVRPLHDGGILQIRDADRRLLASVERSQRVEARDEVVRLLGADAAVGMPDPCWWVEVRARPDEAGRETAHRVADALALRSGGTVWTSGPGDPSEWEETDHPAVERAAAEAIVIAQDREVVPLSSWISDAMPAGRGAVAQILTPRGARLTHALRTLVTSPRARWVVRAEDGSHFDGVSGYPLRWDAEHAYVPLPGEDAAVPPEGFLDDAPLGAQLVLDLSVRHREPFAPPLGRAVEAVTEHLAGCVPVGWGPHEPALAAWEPERLVRLARHRVPRPTVTHFSGPRGVGHPFSGSVRVTWNGERAAERITMAVGFEDGVDLPTDALPGLVGTLAARDLLDVLHVRWIRGRADVTYEPRWHGLAVPLGMAVGPDGVRRVGGRKAVAGPLGGTVLGEGGRQAAWYPVPEGAGNTQRAMAAIRAQLTYLGAAAGG
ncbi:DUF6177 family protein [Nocardiopsis sp. EMB25]|uniref:DUF6177 family protein n=1 Tax=Nocardiopsis sp. EMB25 TaxID=2835867 RepID=UPI00228511A9|nr:DUF6177 family protein [Nocardiopsis sp. EMB25]MCY9787063.1 DUF6177 family protein [Nocardiopsis sp. EMB25]